MLTNEEAAGLLITIGGQAHRIRSLEQEVVRLRQQAAIAKKAEAPAKPDDADAAAVVADPDLESATGVDPEK